VEGRNPNRTYCPLCPRNYTHYRSCKRHCVLDHHRRYEHRYDRCIEFASEEEFKEAWVKAKAAQDSGQTRRDRRVGIGSPPARSAPPYDEARDWRPLFRNSSTEGRTGGLDTRTVVLQDKNDVKHGPPKTGQSEAAITISNDSDTDIGKKKVVAHEMPSPSAAAVADVGKVTLPPNTTGVGEPSTSKPKGGNLRGSLCHQRTDFRN